MHLVLHQLLHLFGLNNIRNKLNIMQKYGRSNSIEMYIKTFENANVNCQTEFVKSLVKVINLSP